MFTAVLLSLNTLQWLVMIILQNKLQAPTLNEWLQMRTKEGLSNERCFLVFAQQIATYISKTRREMKS